eukprot:2859916-Pyramimonas_sp.AAC.1
MHGDDRPTRCLVRDEPRPLKATTPVGCARNPYPWDKLEPYFNHASAGMQTYRRYGMDDQLVHPPPYHAQHAKAGEPDSPPQALTDQQVLSDLVLQGVELAGRHDSTAGAATPFVGQHGPPRFRLQLLTWKPPRRRVTFDSRMHDWATVQRLAEHVRMERDRLQRYAALTDWLLWRAWACPSLRTIRRLPVFGTKR